MTELILTACIKQMIKKEFLGVYVQRVSDKFLCGLPDLRIICYGLSADIEVKMPKKGRVAPIQEKVMETIRAAGGEAVVVRSVDEARLFMHNFWKKARNYYEYTLVAAPRN